MLLDAEGLYTEALRHSSLYTKCFCAQNCLNTRAHTHTHTDALTHRCRYTDAETHKHTWNAFTPSDSYAHRFLHTNTYTRRGSTQTFLYTDAFTHRRFYTQLLLHTHSCLCTQMLDTQTVLHTPFTRRNALQLYTHKQTFTQS